MNCLYPKCQKSVYSRGLCNTHHTSARLLVGYKKITWQELEKNGKALPRVKKGDGNTAQWFLTNNKK